MKNHKSFYLTELRNLRTKIVLRIAQKAPSKIPTKVLMSKNKFTTATQTTGVKQQPRILITLYKDRYD